ncbi:MAG: hypothetical protein GY928_34005 [Colwellia sp.]|nr:hypothetical protein [Colwellia sp.]
MGTEANTEVYLSNDTYGNTELEEVTLVFGEPYWIYKRQNSSKLYQKLETSPTSSVFREIGKPTPSDYVTPFGVKSTYELSQLNELQYMLYLAQYGLENTRALIQDGDIENAKVAGENASKKMVKAMAMATEAGDGQELELSTGGKPYYGKAARLLSSGYYRPDLPDDSASQGWNLVIQRVAIHRHLDKAYQDGRILLQSKQPITEEYLVQVGFEKSGDKPLSYMYGDLEIFQYHDEWMVLAFQESDIDAGIKSVYQLNVLLEMLH